MQQRKSTSKGVISKATTTRTPELNKAQKMDPDQFSTAFPSGVRSTSAWLETEQTSNSLRFYKMLQRSIAIISHGSLKTGKPQNFLKQVPAFTDISRNLLLTDTPEGITFGT